MVYVPHVRYEESMMFICELPKREQLMYYKAIKKALVELGCFSYANIKECMTEKVKDLDGLF